MQQVKGGVMDLAKKIAELEQELKIIETNFHRVSGAIAILKQLQKEESEQPTKENS